jgi:hypothetical protein
VAPGGGAQIVEDSLTGALHKANPPNPPVHSDDSFDDGQVAGARLSKGLSGYLQLRGTDQAGRSVFLVHDRSSAGWTAGVGALNTRGTGQQG